MTQYTFKPNASAYNVKWSDPSFWAGGIVPNAPDADVDFPIVTQVGSGDVYTSIVFINKGDSFAVRSVALRDALMIEGSLSVSGQLTQDQYGEIILRAGRLNVGSLLINSRDVQGDGQIVAGTLTNNAQINGGDLTIDAGTFTNTGVLAAGNGRLALNVGSGGYAGLTGGTLSAGELAAYTDGTLAIHASGPIIVDAATIRLAGGMITSFDPATGRDVAITSSLNTVSARGNLSIESSYHFDQLTIAGALNLNGKIAVDRLTIVSGGHLDGAGTVASPIRNDGVIHAGRDLSGLGYGGTLVLSGPVNGSGSLEILRGHAQQNRFDPSFGATLEIGDATAQNVKFDDALGTLVLDKPASFIGSIVTGGVNVSIDGSGRTEGSHIVLAGVSLQSITGTSYVGNAAGGTLTLQQANGPLTLKFLGSHDLSNFVVSAGPQTLSSDPPSLRIEIKGRGTISTQDFNGNGEADLMWLNANGSFQSWSNRTPVGAMTDQFTTNAFATGVAPSWKITDSFDFNGDGCADILWRNTNGAVSVWTGSASSAFRLGAFDAYVGTSWKIAGAGDFNGDGKGDILWRNDDGSITTWASTGTSFQQQAYNHGSVGTDWKVAGVGDFNGDGKADIFWRNEGDGAVSIWNSTGTSFQESSFLQASVARTYHAQGVGDFNGDGFDDIVWRSNEGEVTVWLGNPLGFTQRAFEDRVPAGWNIATVGDFNGDKLADLMWRNTEGYTSIWNSGGSYWQKGATFDTGVGTDWTLGGHIFPL